MLLSLIILVISFGALVSNSILRVKTESVDSLRLKPIHLSRTILQSDTNRTVKPTKSLKWYNNNDILMIISGVAVGTALLALIIIIILLCCCGKRKKNGHKHSRSTKKGTKKGKSPPKQKITEKKDKSEFGDQTTTHSSTANTTQQSTQQSNLQSSQQSNQVIKSSNVLVGNEAGFTNSELIKKMKKVIKSSNAESTVETTEKTT